MSYIRSFVAWVIHRFFRSRKNVMEKNIRFLFPDLQDSEVMSIQNQHINLLSDMIVLSLKRMVPFLSSSSVSIVDLDVFHRLSASNQSAIIVLSHYSNWESSISGCDQLDRRCVFVYKRSPSKWVNYILEWIRKRKNSYLVSSKNIVRYMIKNKKEPIFYFFLSDQMPYQRGDKSYRVNFFGHQIDYNSGPEKLAKLLNLPVCYLSIGERVDNAYKVTLQVLQENPAEVEKGVITQKIAAALEGKIRDKPYLWLWGHKRFKKNMRY